MSSDGWFDKDRESVGTLISKYNHVEMAWDESKNLIEMKIEYLQASLETY